MNLTSEFQFSVSSRRRSRPKPSPPSSEASLFQRHPRGHAPSPLHRHTSHVPLTAAHHCPSPPPPRSLPPPTHRGLGNSNNKRKRMDRSQHTGKSMSANQDRSSWFVCPEVLRTSGGADAPAVVALRAPLRQAQYSCKESSGCLDSGLMY